LNFNKRFVVGLHLGWVRCWLKTDWFTRWHWNTLWYKNHCNYQTILCTIRTAWNIENSRQCNKL